MGWKASMIIIENPDKFNDEKAILKAIRKTDFQIAGDTTFGAALYPRDESINIGHYKGNLVITDDYLVTTNSLERARSLELTIEERNLCKLFPKSEIIIVACHSVVNFHGYSLIQNGRKLRLKTISADHALLEFGERTIEEEKLYADSYQKDDANFWKDDAYPDEEYTEDQLMEDFTFTMAKRRLGIQLDQTETDEWMEIPFNKYTKQSVGWMKRIYNRIAR